MWLLGSLGPADVGCGLGRNWAGLFQLADMARLAFDSADVGCGLGWVSSLFWAILPLLSWLFDNMGLADVGCSLGLICFICCPFIQKKGLAMFGPDFVAVVICRPGFHLALGPGGNHETNQGVEGGLPVSFADVLKSGIGNSSAESSRPPPIVSPDPSILENSMCDQHNLVVLDSDRKLKDLSSLARGVAARINSLLRAVDKSADKDEALHGLAAFRLTTLVHVH
ncbi:hypothetical protein Nepgr_024023 [Nepenthes gracilis]|uniref:Uncharacterized protein n=1 Tax=Nepenthes gracilis TaxID=150966 RepID=A0AAD3T3M2_NEPGR|nr:hypothetical protein Nepgr_024023 [Nepenthes gracilis]